MKRLARALHLDRHIATTLVLRLWAVAAGLVNLLMVPTHLGAAEQGYYYTFMSVIALQVFFELGLNQVLTQFTSHEFAHLHAADPGADRSSRHYQRLISLMHGITRWYAGAAILFALTVGGGGFYFFVRTGTAPLVTWAPAWFVLVAASSLTLWLSPRFSFLEGTGRIGDVARMRVEQAVIGYGCMWIALACGFGLAAAPMVPVAAALYSLVWLRRRGGLLNQILRDELALERISWRKEVLPLQWRISVSWMSSYLIFNLFTPFVFARTGEVQAGQVGMSLAVFTSITNIGMSWIYAKTPQLSMLAAQKDYAGMRAVFWPSATRSLGAIVVVSLAFLAFSAELREVVPRIGSRLLPPNLMLYLAVIAAANCCVFSAAAFMRSFKREPMLAVSVVTSLFAAAAIYIGSGMGIPTMMQLYTAVMVALCLPWTGLIFARFYRTL